MVRNGEGWAKKNGVRKMTMTTDKKKKCKDCGLVGGPEAFYLKRAVGACGGV